VTRFAFIDREKALYDVTVLCRLMKVSRSGFYAWLSRPKSDRTLADEVLTEQIREAFNHNRQVYGSPRITPNPLIRASTSAVSGSPG